MNGKDWYVLRSARHLGHKKPAAGPLVDVLQDRTVRFFKRAYAARALGKSTASLISTPQPQDGPGQGQGIGIGAGPTLPPGKPEDERTPFHVPRGRSLEVVKGSISSHPCQYFQQENGQHESSGDLTLPPTDPTPAQNPRTRWTRRRGRSVPRGY